MPEKLDLSGEAEAHTKVGYIPYKFHTMETSCTFVSNAGQKAGENLNLNFTIKESPFSGSCQESFFGGRGSRSKTKPM